MQQSQTLSVITLGTFFCNTECLYAESQRHDIQHNDTQRNDIRHNGTQYRYAECPCLVSFMLNVVNKPIMLSVAMQNVIILSVVVP